jgi:hypothetical protein
VTAHNDPAAGGSEPELIADCVADPEDESRWVCCPEWCEEEAVDQHSPTCPDHLMTATDGQTKAEFVGMCENIAKAAITAYKFMLEDGSTDNEAVEQAVEEEVEAAVCFAGIGSCGRGWCKHG